MKQTDSSAANEGMLDDAFADMRATPPAVPESLMARIVADGEAMQPSIRREGGAFWRQVLAGIGGWPAAAGLAAATCAGVWIGGVAPDDVLFAVGLSDGLDLGMTQALGSFDLLLVEG